MQCPNCHAEIPDSAVFCGNCGQRLKALAQPPPPAPVRTGQARRKGLPGWVWGALGGGAVLLAFGVYFLARPASLSRSFSAPAATPSSLQAATAPAGDEPTEPPHPPSEPAGWIPAQVGDVLANPKVTRFDDFADLSAWSYPETGVELTGEGARLSEINGEGTYIYRAEAISAGQAVLITFRPEQADSEFEVYLTRGEWETPAYAHFGLYRRPELYTSIWDGARFIGGEPLNESFTFTSGRTYYLLLVPGRDGDFRMRIGDLERLDDLVDYSQRVDSEWDGFDWNLAFHVDKGVTTVGSYTEISFSGYR